MPCFGLHHLRRQERSTDRNLELEAIAKVQMTDREEQSVGVCDWVRDQVCGIHVVCLAQHGIEEGHIQAGRTLVQHLHVDSAPLQQA